jgi:hypothetical protein
MDALAVMNALSDAKSLNTSWKDLILDLKAKAEVAGSAEAARGAAVLVLCQRVFEKIGNHTLAQAQTELANLIGAMKEPKSTPLSTEALAIVDYLVTLLTKAQEKIGSLPTPAPTALLRTFLVKLLTKTQQIIGSPPNPAPTALLKSLLEPSALWILAMRSMDTRIPADMPVVDAIRSVVDHAPLPLSLREVLRPVVANANFDLAQIRSGIQTWYDNVMERASGWFKRHTTLLLFSVGTIIAAPLNINPILIAGDLARDPALRASGLAFAQDIVDKSGDSSLAQQIVFARAAKRLKWTDRASVIVNNAMSDSTTNSQSFAVLTAEIQPFLLRSGAFVGLLPQVDLSTAQTGRKLESGELDRLKASVCKALLDTKAIGAVNRTSSGQGNASGNQNSTVANADCASVNDAFVKVDNTLNVANVFWSSPDIVWDTKLGHALWEARVATLKAGEAQKALSTSVKELAEAKEAATKAGEAQKSTDSEKAGAAKAVAAKTEAMQKAQSAANDAKNDVLPKMNVLADQLASAIKKAEETNAHAVDFLSRIPSLGWDGKLLGESLGAKAGYLLFALVGWILTGLMVSFGAPFWFDLLSKLINRRVTGPKPETDTST